MRRGAALLALLALAGGLDAGDALGHAGLQRSDPAAGSTLGATPTAVRLAFSERPEASLTAVRVLDADGTTHQVGAPRRVAGDPLAVEVQVEPLDPGVYTVSWRVVSAVDGHATTGTFAFGVGVSPEGAAAETGGTTSPVASPLEMLGRWFFLAGLVALLGAAAASAARFGGAADVRLGAVGFALSVAGLALLGEAQRRGAATSLAGLADSSVGRALVWRAAALAAAGASLALAWWGGPRIRRTAVLGAGLAALAAAGVHVAAGHAAAGDSTRAGVAFQWLHVVAAGVWIGGLVALLLRIRGAASTDKAAAVRRFSLVAAGGLAVVAVTGAVRSVEQLGSWGQLASSGYGRGVAAKVVLLLAVAALGLRNRRRSVPAAAADLGPLRRTSRMELAVAAGALAVAAVLGTLSPPAAGLPPLGLVASGADFATTVRVDLETASPQPGPNRFVVRVRDYDTNAPVADAEVSLRFVPLDDPDEPPTTLALARAADGSYAGSGANLTFDGRWEVTARVERAGGEVAVPLEVEARGPPQFVSVERVPGEAPRYTIRVEGLGYVRISPDPERAGRSTIVATCFTVVEDEARIDRLVLTLSAGGGPARQQAVRRVSRGGFAADVELAEGSNTVGVVARTRDGNRMRATIDLDVPGR